MDLNAFLALAVVGAFLALVVKYIKEKTGSTGNTTKLLLIVLAVAVGAGVYFLSKTPYWEAVVAILVSASTVYALLIKDTPIEKLFSNKDDSGTS